MRTGAERKEKSETPFFGVMRYVFLARKQTIAAKANNLKSKIEYLVVAIDDAAKKTRLSLAQAEILKSLARGEALRKAGPCKEDENGEQ